MSNRQLHIPPHFVMFAVALGLMFWTSYWQPHGAAHSQSCDKLRCNVATANQFDRQDFGHRHTVSALLAVACSKRSDAAPYPRMTLLLGPAVRR